MAAANKLRVLQVGKFFPPARGGIETVLRFLVEGLSSKEEIQLETLVFNESATTTTEVHKGVPITRLARWEQLFSVPIAPAMYWWLRSRHYDIVHLHVPNPLASMCVLATMPCKKLVVSYHSDVVKQKLLLRLYAPIQRRLLNKADKILVSSQRLIDSSTVLSEYKDKCAVVPFGIDPDPYIHPTEEDLAEQKRLEQEMNKPFVLFAGRLVYYKGLQYLLRAIKDVDCHFVIAGDGPFYANLKLLAHGLEDRVTFTGNISDSRMRALMSKCELFVLPSISTSETFGLVQLEAMAAGKAIINTDLATGVPEVSRHEESGLTVPPRDAAALAKALNDLLANDSKRNEYGRNARDRLLKHYSVQAMADVTMKVYRELMESW